MFDIEFIVVCRPNRVFNDPLVGLEVYDALTRADEPAERHDTPGGLIVYTRGRDVVAVYDQELGWGWDA